MKKRIWQWGPALVMMILIFTASGTPGKELPQFGVLDMATKKGGHALGYALLGISYLRGLAHRKKASRGNQILAVVLACLYAASDEFHQRFTPDRTPAVHDVLIDAIGATFGVALWSWIRGRLMPALPGKPDQGQEDTEIPAPQV